MFHGGGEMHSQQDPQELRIAAARLRANARYADGEQYYLDMARARELENQAAELAATRRKAEDKAQRRKDLQRIHIAKHDLGLREEIYRSVLYRVTGKTSAGDFTGAERRAVLDEFRRLGWKPDRIYRIRPTDRATTQADKIRALWIELNKIIDLRDPTERGLGRFCRRLTGKQRPEWLRRDDANTMIEVLKSWLARAKNQREVTK
jgi:phage gp16-like protein